MPCWTSVGNCWTARSSEDGVNRTLFIKMHCRLLRVFWPWVSYSSSLSAISTVLSWHSLVCFDCSISQTHITVSCVVDIVLLSSWSILFVVPASRSNASAPSTWASFFRQSRIRFFVWCQNFDLSGCDSAPRRSKLLSYSLELHCINYLILYI